MTVKEWVTCPCGIVNDVIPNLIRFKKAISWYKLLSEPDYDEWDHCKCERTVW